MENIQCFRRSQLMTKACVRGALELDVLLEYRFWPGASAQLCLITSKNRNTHESVTKCASLLSANFLLKLFLLRRMFSKFHIRSPRKRMRLQSLYHSLILFTPLPWSCRQQHPSKHWHLCTRLHSVTATSQQNAVLNFEAICCFLCELCRHNDSLNVYCLPTKTVAIVGNCGAFYSF